MPLCGQLGAALQIDASPVLLLLFRNAGPLVNSVISSPDMEIKLGVDGGLLAAEDYNPNFPAARASAMANNTLAMIKDKMRHSNTLELEGASIGMRPNPADEQPVVGFSSQIDGLYIAVMHAGVTLAPVVGRFAASENINGVESETPETCQPARFMSGMREIWSQANRL